MNNIEIVNLKTDILIIGGGAAGCYAGARIKEEDPKADVLIVDKAHIKRSGCLAAGISAINAYLNPGVTPKDFLDYVKKDSEGLVRDDLVYTLAQGLNKATHWLEKWGLPFLKDEVGNYVAKGKRSVKINGEHIKPIMAKAVEESGVEVLNRVNISNYIVVDDQVRGAFGFSVRENKFYVIQAKAVICATGGAAGIYKPNNPGSARHKMWYSPFNTGAGYAMGIRAGAEMTTFEMRFIALRTKDTISPTGVLAQSFKAKQVNGEGIEYQEEYKKNSTPYRLHATLEENKEGRGPCYLDVTHLSDESNHRLKRAYLNMSPGIVLKWADGEIEPNQSPVEIYGTEPYIVGGHSQSGYWVDSKRRSTIAGLYAAGDVAGGAPKKYVTGAMVEGEIAGLDALDYIRGRDFVDLSNNLINKEFDRVFSPLEKEEGFLPEDLEERLQKVMDEYAGGISTNYRLDEGKLIMARKELRRLKEDLTRAKAEDVHQLMNLHEVIDRVDVARVLVEHLLYRKETRWRCYQERVDYPKKDDENWFKFVNSKYNQELDQIEIIEREHIRLGDLDGSQN
ncbi:dissimilatory adenylylsulfate reductase alpha subunit precursor [Orenia metallireducens]|jgi:adenylylsulfate reductase subunit A|uniref:Dissimilatory adenylylsulfate reductase alpha subunit n=1 Tax=Orenia metallireducens TaxID=1413210 RepID=A0A285GD18_9FIRM|nr:adenylyl-sulfate reductase subunit alpha [Orenia metallireducens]PRX32501.1 dissimilatory adenylylsulfate reductase alpha subunit precursor [Orenia metallireducens]SNY21064.1 dissimilatory adenylylsulfate reductase alpha subunit precursor [Orenia metallireducens]